MADKTRDGIFANLRLLAKPLRDLSLIPYTEDIKLGKEFNIEQFIQSKNKKILYLFSKEGAGTVSVFTTMLTIWIDKYAERYANSNGGRLPIPLLFELDEAANICKWYNLPDLYSHYGSKGILISTYLQ